MKRVIGDGKRVDLKSGYPWWAVRNGLMHAFPTLREDVRCDVAVIGGGISGALIADEFSRHGHDVVVVEQRDIGWGSTAASTALLQYEIDTHLVDLARWYGEDNALLAYRACAEAIAMLAQRAHDVRGVGFARNDSLYYASRRRHHDRLREEFALRARHGFEVEWLERGGLAERYGIDASGAILSVPAARVDPYRFAYRLLMRVVKRGGGVYDRVTVNRFEVGARGVVLHDAAGQRIHARHLILAAGYANQCWLQPRVARNRSSYAYITDPIDATALGPWKHTLLWESARPYLYLRATDEGRLLIGGLDDAIDVPARRDARVEKKAQQLMKKAQQVLPQLPLQPTFSWAGTFAETEDGLPFFGPHPQYGARVHFAMAYGGNGITYSMLGAGLLRALVERRRHPLATLFGFSRLER